MECLEPTVIQVPPFQPEQINYSIHFIPRKREAKATAKGKVGKISNKEPIFCPLLLVASNVTY